MPVAEPKSASAEAEKPGEGKFADPKQALRKPPSRPQLMGPPARPKPPASPPPVAAIAPPVVEPATPQKIGPISLPSERMQYRAIGLLKGKYIASAEQFNRGNIAIEDGTLIDSVLLGRVTSLIKKHIDLDQAHLWVVYPRTLYNEENAPALHMQIVGVWEPETLNADDADKQSQQANSESESDSDSDSDSEFESDAAEPQFLSTAEAEEQCDAFSIRGEIAKYAEDKHEIVVNIVQKSKSEAKPKRPFKLLINGQLNGGRATGYFWDLQVERQAGQLVLKEGTPIAVVPPKKKPKNARSGGARGGPGGRRPAAGKPRSAGAPVPKPVPRPIPKSGETLTGENPIEKSVDKRVAEKPVTTKLAVENPVVESPVVESPVVESPVVESLPAVERKAELPAGKKPAEPAKLNSDSAS
jgi:hypothetical protein